LASSILSELILCRWGPSAKRTKHNATAVESGKSRSEQVIQYGLHTVSIQYAVLQFAHLADYVQEFLPTLCPLVLGVDHQRALIQRKCLVLACLCGVRWSRERE
jgi:hypothetical protein